MITICGDLHGEWKKPLGKLKDGTKLLVVGDFGVGFGKLEGTNVHYKEIEPLLEEKDITIYTIRGNHDNPEYFDGNHDYPRLKFLPDHQIIEIEGKRVYPIGGAVSHDIDIPNERGKTRRKINSDLIRYGSSKRVWWENEKIVEKRKGLPSRVEIILSHDAPLGFPPIMMRDKYISYETWMGMLGERQYLDFVWEELKCDYWFYGHYHESNSGHIGESFWRGLAEGELYDYPGE